MRFSAGCRAPLRTVVFLGFTGAAGENGPRYGSTNPLGSGLDCQVKSTGEPLSALLKQLNHHVSPQRKRQALVAVLLMLCSGLLEVLSVAAVPPLLLGLLRSGNAFNPVLALIFGALVIAAALVRWFSLSVQMHLAAAISSDLVSTALANILASPYQEQLKLDRAATITMLAPQQRLITNQVLQQLLLLCSGMLLASGVLTVVIAMAWQLVLPVLFVVALSYGIIYPLTAKRLQRNGGEVMHLQRSLIRQIQNSLGSIRDMWLSQRQASITARFDRDDRLMRQREARNMALANLPRYLIEPTSIVAITTIGAYWLHTGKSVEQVIPALALIAFASQRLLPLGQQVWSAWANIQSASLALESLLTVLEQPHAISSRPSASPPLNWQHCSLQHTYFSYAGSGPWVIRDLNLTIHRGEWIGLEGPSGAGKSTVVDLMLGLLEPSRGSLCIDSIPIAPGSQQLRRWQACAAHAAAIVPLIPGSVRMNLGFHDHSDPDDRETQAIRISGITNLLDCVITDSGSDLSTGQRQRVGIARALAQPISLLVLDEATSGLDSGSEADLLMGLHQEFPDLTVVLISHRQAPLRQCDRVLNIAALQQSND